MPVAEFLYDTYSTKKKKQILFSETLIVKKLFIQINLKVNNMNKAEIYNEILQNSYTVE